MTDRVEKEAVEQRATQKPQWLKDEKQRMFLMLFILWAAIGYLDLMNIQVGRSYPISVLYALVILPAAVVFGRVGLGIATLAVILMYHFTNDKPRLASYTETEIMRLGFAVLIGVAFERISRDREQIRDALANLQKETKVREDLTHMLVHDLRTPLTGIITSLQTLQMGILGDLDDDQKEMVDFAVADGHRLLEMVNQILDVSRLEAGEMPLKLEEVELCDLAEGACRIALPIAAESGITLTNSCNGLRARLDPELMRRVLVNLIGNALKFTPRNGEVSVLSEPAAGGGAHVVVRDTGWGIPKADLKRIFEKYAQARSGAKAGPSSGLGLTFCRLAVEAHGGKIWADSDVGKGTEIHIVLPDAVPPPHSRTRPAGS